MKNDPDYGNEASDYDNTKSAVTRFLSTLYRFGLFKYAPPMTPRVVIEGTVRIFYKRRCKDEEV